MNAVKISRDFNRLSDAGLEVRSQQIHDSMEHIGTTFENKVIANGGRYFVEFSAKNPSNSKLLLQYPAPDSISCPYEGWSYLP